LTGKFHGVPFDDAESYRNSCSSRRGRDFPLLKSAFDPKRKSRGAICCIGQRGAFNILACNRRARDSLVSSSSPRPKNGQGGPRADLKQD
jgi:hypothetical protein